MAVRLAIKKSVSRVRNESEKKKTSASPAKRDGFIKNRDVVRY